jgi:hypothetical protein
LRRANREVANDITRTGANSSIAANATAANAPTNDASRVDELVQDTCTGANCERALTSLISLRPADLAKPNGK